MVETKLKKYSQIKFTRDIINDHRGITSTSTSYQLKACLHVLLMIHGPRFTLVFSFLLIKNSEER